MRKDSLNLKLKRGVFAGVSLLALAAVGCGGGGGGGTLVAPPALQIGNGAAPSIGKVAGAQKQLGRLAAGGTTVQVYDATGRLLDTFTGFVAFPVRVELSTAMQTAAQEQGSLAFRAFNNAGLDYPTVAQLTANDLASNGVIQESGADRVEAVDAGSAVRTALIEQQMSETIGTPVRIGVPASEALQAQLRKAIVTDNTLAVDELAGSLKESAKTTTSLLGRAIASVGASLTATTSISAGDAIRKLVSTGQNRTSTAAVSGSVLSQLKKVRKVAGAMGRMARQIKRSSGNANRAAKLRTFLGNLGAATENNANAAASGADVVANSLELASKVNNANLNTQVDNLINNSADVNAAIAGAADTVLTAIDATVTQAIADAGGVGELSSVVSGVVAGASDANSGSTTATRQGALARALETVSSAIALIPGKENKDLFVGKALAASSESTGAAVEILKTVATANANLDATDRVDVSDAITSAAGGSAEDAKQAMAAVASAVTNLGANTGVVASAFTKTAVTVDAVVANASSGLSGDVLQSLKQSGIGANAIQDDARISGGSANVKPGESVTLNNDSVETQDGTYTYTWAVTGNSGTVTSNNDSATFTAGTTAGSYSVVLSQRRNGAATDTATFNYSIASVLPPQVTLSRTNVAIKKGGSGSLVVGIVDPETGRTITASATVGATCGSNSTGFTVGSLASTGGTLSVTVANTVAAGTYCGRVSANPSNGSAVTKDFSVVVPELASTKVLISGGGVFTEGSAALPISATAIQEQAIVTGAKFSLWVAPGSTRTSPAVTGALTSGTNTLSTTIARTAGTYTIVAEVTNGTTTVTQSRSLVVNAVGAPTITSVSSNGAPVNAGDTLNYVITGNTLALDVDVVASAASGSTISSYVLSVSGATTSNQVTGTAAAIQNVALNPGTNTVTVVVNSSENKSATRVFTVVVTQRKVITVSNVAISGNSVNGSLSNTYANGAVVSNASAVTGLDLNQTSGLQVVVSAAQNTAATGNVQITVSLTDAGSVRNASLTVNNAALVTSGAGWDVSSASTLVFAGQKTDGSTAQVSTSSSNVANFADLFAAGTGTLIVNIDAMKAAMISILSGASNAFASSLENVTGSNIGLAITVTGENFNFQTDAGSSESFNTFRFTNITVQ